MNPLLLSAAMLMVGAAPTISPSGEKTIVISQKDAKRLRSSKGATLQWIDWNTRGTVKVVQGPVWRLTATQAQAGGRGRMFVDGFITKIGDGFFTLSGTIRITDTPDVGRKCEATKDWHFAVTQNRSYYRLREFEWCDQLTDYIDIHF